MKKIVISEAFYEANIIHYKVSEEKGVGLLQQDVVDLSILFFFF